MVSRLFGVAGMPAAHSLSPALFKKYNGDKGSYIIIEEDSVDKVWERFNALSMCGINVTSPYKSVHLWEHCFDVSLASEGSSKYSQAVRELGFFNTLYRGEDGTIRIYNTDIDGAVYGVKDIKGKRVVIIGGGGAAAAARYGYQLEGAAEVITLNRSPKEGFMPLNDIDKYVQKADIIVNTLKIKFIDNIRDNQLFVDAIYHNSPYTFMSEKANYIGGLNWLTGQALPAYKLFIL